jgi:hypothetical protein
VIGVAVSIVTPFPYFSAASAGTPANIEHRTIAAN